ncbi:MAG: gamma-glutamylcyclotransferase family protein [Pseudomonadota bacterium]
MSKRLFLYGVLRADIAQWDFLDGLGLGSPALVSGRLYAIPGAARWYPAMIPTHDYAGVRVLGFVHDAAGLDIAAIDAFEGADYERHSVTCHAVGDAGYRTAQAYCWTSPLPAEAAIIGHGNFGRWLAETGNSPLREA